jgi:histidinol phosphatase-like enzyme
VKLIILGRDGILNEYRDDHVKAPGEWLPLPGALEAVSRLNHAGWHAVVATNQAGIGRGMIDMAAVNLIHAHNFMIARDVLQEFKHLVVKKAAVAGCASAGRDRGAEAVNVDGDIDPRTFWDALGNTFGA